MTHESPTSETARPPQRRRTKRSLVWRVAAIVLVVLVMLALAHYLRHPSEAWDDEEGGGALTFGQWPPEVQPSGGPPKPDETPTTPREAQDSLRKIMAGLVMAAIGDDDPDEPPSADDEAKRQFIADAFGLPHDYPRNKAPADLMPEEAQVLMVLENPEHGASRMVLVRMRKDVGATLEAFHKQYDAKGWQCDELADPEKDHDAQPDRGWLLRFRKGRRERILYARPRAGGEETLVAIYDPRQ